MEYWIAENQLPIFHHSYIPFAVLSDILNNYKTDDNL